jgi:hypothetical protein
MVLNPLREELSVQYLPKLVMFALFAALPLSSAVADPPSKDQVVATVKKAIAFYKENGRAKALAELNNKNGQFAKGEDYVDVHDLNGVCLAHPTSPEVVGTNRLEQKVAYIYENAAHIDASVARKSGGHRSFHRGGLNAPEQGKRLCEVCEAVLELFVPGG